MFDKIETLFKDYKNEGGDHTLVRKIKTIDEIFCRDNKNKNTSEIMKQLEVSRGNVNINTRTLIDWGLVHKKFKKGERKEYFIAEKDVVKIFKAVIYQRKKKELDPMLKVLSEIKAVEGCCEESNEFCKVVNGLHTFSAQADKALDNLINTESKWLLSTLMRFMH